MPHAIANTTTVLNAVATFEFTPSIPTFAKIAVSAANTADKSAKTAHIMFLRSSYTKGIALSFTITRVCPAALVLSPALQTELSVSQAACIHAVVSSLL